MGVENLQAKRAEEEEKGIGRVGAGYMGKRKLKSR